LGTITSFNNNPAIDSVNALTTDSVSLQEHTSTKKPLVGAYVSLLLFMVVYCARPEDWIPGLTVLPLAKITAILALLALVLSILHARQRLPREVLYLGLLVGQLFLAAGLSPVWRGGAFQATLNFAKILVPVVIMALVVTTGKRLQRLIFIQAASVAVIALVALVKGRLILGRLEGTLGGNYSDPNDLALAIIISLPLSLALLFLSRSWLQKAVWALAMLVMLYTVFLTGSRGGFLSLIVTAVVLLWEFAIRGRRHYLAVLAALVGVLLWQFSSEVLAGRLKGTFNANQNIAASYASAEGRKQLFWRSIEVTKNHPLFGVGSGNFEEVSGSWHVTHNSFTQMSAEGGLPACILYTLILWSGYKNLGLAKRHAKGQRELILLTKGLKTSLVGYVAGSFFLSVAYQFFPYFLVAYTTALALIAKKSAAQSRTKLSRSEEKPNEEIFAPQQRTFDYASWSQ
jgi:putative inorganic carbon (HCO3(-)) transporter